MKIKGYRDAQLHYTKDDRGDATGAFEMFVAEEPSSMDQEPRRTGFKSGGSYDYGSMQHKINSVNAAYKRYLNMRKGKQKYKVIPFEIFSEEFAKENFADGGSAGQLVQPNAQSERIGFKDGTPVKFDESRVKIPTGKFVGEGRDKSQIYKIKNNTTGSVRYTTTGAGGGTKKLYKSIKKLKDAKLESLPDEFFVQSKTPLKDGIKEITYKNRKTGETKVFYKPRVGPNKATIPGRGAETKEEAQKFVDNYFKENPKQVRVRDPKKDYASKDKRKKVLEETDKTKATGTKKFNYHHVRQIAGGVPLTTDDVMIIDQKINSKLGGKVNESLNRISAAIQKNNRLALEAMNAKDEGAALDYMKRSDELNAQAEKIVNSAIDDLPKKYKGSVGFNQFTLPRNEYGLPISNEPMIIKKVGGMPVSKDAIDLTTLNLKQEKEFRKIVKAQAEAGKIGQIKGLIPFMKNLGIKCQLSNGINCKDPRAYTKSLNELSEKAAQGNTEAASKLKNFSSKALKTGKVLKNALGPLAIASEVALEGGIALNKTLETGVPFKQAFGESYLNKLLGPKLQIDVEAERAKEFAKGEEYAMAERGRRKAPFMPQSATADAQRLKKREQEMEQAFPTMSVPDINLALENVGLTQQETGMTFPELQDYIKRENQMQAIADAGGVANMAGGGIAKEAGDRSGAMTKSMNPDSQGLSYLMNRVKKVQE